MPGQASLHYISSDFYFYMSIWNCFPFRDSKFLSVNFQVISQFQLNYIENSSISRANILIIYDFYDGPFGKIYCLKNVKLLSLYWIFTNIL